MCGITGIVRLDGAAAEEAKVSSMMQKIKHRGPDDQGVFTHGQVSMGFVRLSILDLSPLGHQPMLDDTERYVITFNGEVYNYIELREELKAKGYTFRSNTDTEVILKSYIEWGKDFLHKLNGMFAIMIFDKETGEIFGARDRFGIKPFYYHNDGNQFTYASEIPPILEILDQPAEANEQCIFDYLVFNRTDQTDSTFFKGIRKLQHGHYIQINKDNVKMGRWYNLDNTRSDAMKTAEDFRKMFSSSVGLRLRSDVPVGVCLSGGLDSSSIVSTLLHDYNTTELNTFSAVYGKGETGDESVFIDEYKTQLKNMHHVYPSADSLYADMHDFVKAHGEPVPSTGPYAQYKVMELAKEHVVVTLDGQGADEHLAGYHYFYGFFFKDLFRSFRWGKLIKEMASYVKYHKSLYGIKSFVYFMLSPSMMTKLRLSEKDYVSADFAKKYSGSNAIAGNLYDAKNLNEALRNHFEYKLEHLLKWEDRNSMFFSLESRVPFLDNRLVEQVLSLKGDHVIRNGVTKSILRESMKGILPEKIRMRMDKTGFDTPEDDWFRSEKFNAFIEEMLQSEQFKNRGLVDADKALDLYRKHLKKEINISKEIWKWINLELWFREFIDKKS